MIPDRFPLGGKVAVVRGAGRSLGRGASRGLAEAGADLVLLSRAPREIEAVARALGRRALAGAQVEAAAVRAPAGPGRVGLGPYAAAQAAIASLTRTLAQKLAPLGVRVNAVTPGKILAPPAADWRAIREGRRDRMQAFVEGACASRRT